ncbi:MAG: hypothetical protein ACI4L6_02980 [Candidatus Onthoplasma sp.]
MNEKKFGFKWLEKLKKVKHIEIYIAIIFIVILALIYLSTTKKSSGTNITNEIQEMTVMSYVDNLETNLEAIINKIGGVSEAKVLISLDMNTAKVTDSKIDLNYFPDVKGVIVTAKGLSNTTSKMKVLHAIEAVIDVSNGNIQILSSD